MVSITQQNSPISVFCPYCLVKPGEECLEEGKVQYNPDGSPAYHSLRINTVPLPVLLLGSQDSEKVLQFLREHMDEIADGSHYCQITGAEGTFVIALRV